MSFWEKYQEIIKRNKSYVCVGLDSDISKLPECLKKDKNPIFSFNKEIIDYTKDYVGAYKPNFAFYLAAGKLGLKALEETIDYIPSYIPIILDVKTGDIGNTMEQYASAFYEIWKCDAITVNPLMGHDVYKPLLSFKDNFFFSLALTSNPTSADYLKREDLYKAIASDLTALPVNQAGAVVGATNSNELGLLRKLMPETLFLVPGIGAQGGSVEEVVKFAGAKPDDLRILINSSRGIIFKDSSSLFAETAEREADKLRKEINSYIEAKKTQ
ncbi:MAG: orotidine-5'-phosphate decarboxylase [Candidatus Cloacimonetes bacterium]|nr:orotidine-5'-phosphate decarboxylase [Candidatus Cloacimonadota bacterium]